MDDDVDVFEYSKRPATFLPSSVPKGLRVVQMTPPGSECSILLVCENPGVPMQPGTLKGLHLVVEDISTARNELLENGVEVEEVVSLGGVLYARFSDPDGNTWLLQQIPALGFAQRKKRFLTSRNDHVDG